MSKTHTVNSTYTNFDLFEYIENTPSAAVAGAMARSVAWRIDSLIQNASRQLFKTVRDGLIKRKTEEMASGSTRDAHAEVMMALRDVAMSEQAFEEFGKSQAGALKNIRDLMRLRDDFHDVAQHLVSLTYRWDGSPDVFVRESIDDAFARPTNMKISERQRNRIAMSVDCYAKEFDATPEELGMLKEQNLKRAELNNKSIAETLDSQQDVVFMIFQFAMTTDVEMDLAEHFWHLDVSLQRALIDSAMSAADRAHKDAQNSKRITDMEFTEICISSLRAQKYLKGVLTSPRFVVREMAEA